MRSKVPFRNFKQASDFLVMLQLYTETKSLLVNKPFPRLPQSDYRRMLANNANTVVKSNEQITFKQVIAGESNKLIPIFRKPAAA